MFCDSLRLIGASFGAWLLASFKLLASSSRSLKARSEWTPGRAKATLGSGASLAGGGNSGGSACAIGFATSGAGTLPPTWPTPCNVGGRGAVCIDRGRTGWVGEAPRDRRVTSFHTYQPAPPSPTTRNAIRGNSHLPRVERSAFCVPCFAANMLLATSRCATSSAGLSVRREKSWRTSRVVGDATAASGRACGDVLAATAWAGDTSLVKSGTGFFGAIGWGGNAAT